MAKKRSLLSEVQGVSANQLRSGPSRWVSVFAKERPDDYASAKEAIVDWLNGGTMKALFHSRASFLRYLTGDHDDVPCDPPVLPHIAASTFTGFINRVQKEVSDGQKEKSR